MSENKKFYWIKLKTDFFDSHGAIAFMMNQKNGSEYVVLYLMLCLSTANSDGRFCDMVGEMLIPYDIEKIKQDTKYFSIDTVRVALELYKKLGLIYEENDGVLAITNFDDMVGASTLSDHERRLNAERQARYRLSHKEESVTVTPEITLKSNVEIRDKSIEIRDIDIRDKENINIHKERKAFVKPTLEEVDEYISENNYSVNADTFWNFYESNGWKVGKNPMKDWKAAIRQWNSKNKPNKPNKPSELEGWLNA